eukprot:gene11682-12894_t
MELIVRKRYSNFVGSQSGEPSAVNQLRHHNLTDLAGCYNKMVDKIGLLNKSIRKLFDITNCGIMEKLLRLSYRNFAFHQIRNQTTKILDDIAQLHAASDNEEVSTSLLATCNCTKEVMYIWDNFLYDISQTVGIISPAKPQEASYFIIAKRVEEQDDATLWKEYIQLTYKKCNRQIVKWKNEMNRLRRIIMKVIQKCRVKSIERRKQCRLENTNLFQMGEYKFTGKYICKKRCISQQSHGANKDQGQCKSNVQEITTEDAEETKSNKTMMEDYEKEKKRRKFYCQTSCREENPSASEEQATVAARKPTSTKKIVLTFVRKVNEVWKIRRNEESATRLENSRKDASRKRKRCKIEPERNTCNSEDVECKDSCRDFAFRNRSPISLSLKRMKFDNTLMHPAQMVTEAWQIVGRRAKDNCQYSE